MALARRSVRNVSGTIWPGFVDAMTALLLVLMFVLTIFMVVQYVLREQISGQATELDELSMQVAGLADALGLERQRTAQLGEEVGSLTATLGDMRTQSAAQQAMISELTEETEAQAERIAGYQSQIASFEEQVASLLSQRDAIILERDTAQADLAETEGEAIRYQIATPRDFDEMGPCILAGPSCDSADVLYEKRPIMLPMTLKSGDRAIIRNAGAYTSSYSSVGFNGFPPLDVVVL